MTSTCEATAARPATACCRLRVPIALRGAVFGAAEELAALGRPSLRLRPWDACTTCVVTRRRLAKRQRQPRRRVTRPRSWRGRAALSRPGGSSCCGQSSESELEAGMSARRLCAGLPGTTGTVARLPQLGLSLLGVRARATCVWRREGRHTLSGGPPLGEGGPWERRTCHRATEERAGTNRRSDRRTVLRQRAYTPNARPLVSPPACTARSAASAPARVASASAARGAR